MKVLIAGGGTGGHLYPGIALAEEVTTRQKGNEVLFVGTQRGIEARVVPGLGFPIEYIDVAGLKGTGLGKRVRGMAQVPIALMQSMRILRRFRPDFAVGVGGYASGPVILAAWMLGMPTAVLEQNTVPGVTNRILAKFVRAVYVMFEASKNYFPPHKVKPLGNPIRRQLLDNFLEERADENDKFTVLVLGGSQGAHTLNLRMVEAVPHLAPIADRIRIVHQTGKNDVDLVKEGYADSGIDTEVSAFIEDMSTAYRSADLIVCRAGATTLAEVMVVKRASILVPFPYAADNHQELNGQSMVDAGASVMLVERELDGEKLAKHITELFENPERRRAMEQAAGLAGRPEAAREIVDALFDATRADR
ncbi:MAG: undecaprenyldiphospho-muramoylpentapeptide beta-N-acetylglucosaminyltransferase [Deltaproteobacteria bacterium]